MKTWDAITDKRILTLHPEIRDRVTEFINTVEKDLNTKLRVTQALRTIEQQNELYAKGRTTPGQIVTKVKGGQSFHNYGLAFDVCIIENGKANFNIPEVIANIALKIGFDWGGSWTSFKDIPHFQMTCGYTCDQLMKRPEKNGYRVL